MIRRLRHLFEAGAFRMLLGVTRIVPRALMARVGATAGSIGYLVDRRHRRITLENLMEAHPDNLTRAEARRVARACWRHFGRILLDSLYFPRLSRETIDRHVRYEGLPHIREAYARGRGVLLFSGHFGHWELIALAQGYLDLPLALVARPLDNPLLERLLADLRVGSGNRVIHKRNAVREILRALRRAEGVAIVLDQDARSSGVFVPFFGRLASTTPTLALVALRTGAAVVPTYSVPEADGGYRVVYEAPLEVRDSGDLDADVLQLTARCTERIEAWVREYPELWLWMHRRWKTRPPGTTDGPEP